MTGDQKSARETWFESRHVHVVWQNDGCMRANLTICDRRKKGDSKSGVELPGHLLTDLTELVDHPVSRFDENYSAWLPNGWPRRRTQCIASSRIGRHPKQLPWWSDAVRTSCMNGFRDGAAMLTGQGMTAEPFVRRMAQLLNCELVDIRIAPRNPDSTWFRKIADDGPSKTLFPMWIFSTGSEPATGLIDQIAIGLADAVRVIKVSEDGNVFHAVQKRLDLTGNSGAVWLLSDEHSASESVRLELLEQGAVQWLLQEGARTGASQSHPDTEIQSSDDRIMDLPNDADEFLAHWTRERGRHPGIETDDERIDRLLFGFSPDSEGAIGALLSIICSRRLLAGSSLTRDSTPIVSFTEVPLAEFSSRRTFRSHLGRWDFELFGIAIRKAALQKVGARPVIYGGESAWSGLQEPDRPWFQLTGSDSDSASIDWSKEREWRIAGDLDLARIAPNDLFVFVPDREAAKKVTGFSRWPVVILPRKPVPAD